MSTTKDNCCGNGILSKSATAAYSDGDLSPSSIFIMHIQGGVNCSRCKESCENVKCPNNKKCAIRHGVPKCICSPNCTNFKLKNGMKSVRGMVCGTDGQTYKNVCRLLKRSCRKKLLISVAYFGPCRSSCANLACPGKKRCLVDQNMIPHCVNCPERICNRNLYKRGGELRAVCGVDGKNYSSVCHIRSASCRKGSAILIAYKGFCKKRATCDNIKCSHNQKCLTENSTGKGRCVTCSRRRWCKKYQRHQTNGPICATNGKSYKNWCEMMMDACDTGSALDTKHFGTCKRKDILKNALNLD